MTNRLVGAILLLYPRRVRRHHGPEIVALIDDLVARDGRSRARLFTRLAVDGLAQRVASTATAWTAAAVLATTTIGGLAVSDFAAASAHQDPPKAIRTAPLTRHHPHRVGRSDAPHHSGRIMRQRGSIRLSPPR
jgi:hypothetical protein